MIVSELARALGLCRNNEWPDMGWHAALYFFWSRVFINAKDLR